MFRKFSIVIVLTAFAAGQTDPSAIPAEIASDAYSIYSAVLNPPRLSHHDANQKYLVLGVTVAKPFREPQACVQPPPSYRSAFQEIVADYLKHRNDSFLLERKMSLSKPYEFLSGPEADQFEKGRIFSQTGPNQDQPKFQGAIDLIRLGNIYFNRPHTLAAVSTDAWCGGLCGLSVWRVFEKVDALWKELKWDSCMRVSQNQWKQPRTRIAAK